MEITKYESLVVELFKDILSKTNNQNNLQIRAFPNEAVDLLHKNRTVIIYSYYEHAAIFLNENRTLSLDDPEFSSNCIKYLNSLG